MKGFCPTVKAFTLVELLVAVTILTMLLVILLGMTQNMSDLWQRSEAQKNAQQSARTATAAITRDLESAVYSISQNGDPRLAWEINPGFGDLENPDAAFWVAASHAGTGDGGLAEVGYFVRWTRNGGIETPELRRFYIPGSDPDSVFSGSNKALSRSLVLEKAPGSDLSNADPKGLVAQNIAGIWIDLLDKDGNKVTKPYDSTSTTSTFPIVAEVALLFLDPKSTQRLNGGVESTIRELYKKGPEEASDQLQAEHRVSSQIFRERIPLRAAPSGSPTATPAPTP